ncbi:arsenosugar biosynthesis radical SAM protein ArsS [bacterium]|nr:arsenosugar biosynthesis radical SAM protein ArsS [bacterium]
MPNSTKNETNRFDALLTGCGEGLKRRPLEVLQLNVGRLCNQTCRHCHVNAGPTRTELMSREVAEACIRFLDATPSIHTVDLTGGAPELSPAFRYLVKAGRARDKRVIDRCNLTVLSEPGQEGLAEFLAESEVDIVASLPCYTAENVNKQRGDGVFHGSIDGLRMLNELGFGISEGESQPGERRRLDLVYNPGGPSLPPSQAVLEADYRKRLWEDFGVRFNNLLTITNMPIGRFRSDLQRAGQLNEYMERLEEAFNPGAIEGLMCRAYLSVDHEGYLYDCDFNQMLSLPLGGGERKSIFDMTAEQVAALNIATDDHCLGCTAGCGSSCGGALT